MPDILLLNQETIDKIAAGEVVERPSSVVKELVENAIDAGASAVTVEIKDGGIKLIRITDNGCGIPHDQVPVAFLRHSTSKIRSAEDLYSIASLGFRGEALSSISAVARVELITKTRDSLTGSRYVIEGSREIVNEEIGAPEGTTFLIKDLFYNTPARRKFLKTAQTEAAYISDMVEKLALSHPEISFKYIQNNQTKLHTSGNGNTKDLIYHIYGREIAGALIPVDYCCEYFTVKGFIGKPIITRGNRNYENYFVNGRYVKSSLLAKAIEEAYKNYIMQHQYPFTVLHFTFTGDLDVNVHPTKMELRIGNNQDVYRLLCNYLYDILSHKDMIPEVPVAEDPKKETKPVERVYPENIPEPFEQRRLNDLRKAVAKDSPYEVQYPSRQRVSPSYTDAVSAQTDKPEVILLGRKKLPEAPKPMDKHQSVAEFFETSGYGKNSTLDPVSVKKPVARQEIKQEIKEEIKKEETYQEITLDQISPEFLTKDARRKHKIIGQLFDTYWLVEYEDKLFIIDQHAAHEKVLYEQTMKRLSEKEFTSQLISPPIILSLDAKETQMLEKYMPQITRLGYEIEHFGGKEYMISAVPDNLFYLDMKDLFIEMLDDFGNLTGRENPQLILEKVASMSCKAAVKGNNRLSRPEIEALFDQLLALENPYNCPHGRPTIISMSKYEIEKKFKRII